MSLALASFNRHCLWWLNIIHTELQDWDHKRKMPILQPSLSSLSWPRALRVLNILMTGGCIAQRSRLRFSTSSPGFEPGPLTWNSRVSDTISLQTLFQMSCSVGLNSRPIESFLCSPSLPWYQLGLGYLFHRRRPPACPLSQLLVRDVCCLVFTSHYGRQIG